MTTEEARALFRLLQTKAVADHLMRAHGLDEELATALAACLAPWIDGSQITPGCGEPLVWETQPPEEPEP